MNKFLYLILLINLNVYSQENQQNTVDSLNIEAINNFRKLTFLYPIKHTGWVTDYEKLYSKNEIENLNSLINKFEEETSNEIAIVTLDSLRVSNSDFEDLSLRIAQEWGIGKPEKNNGILIAISRDYRKIRIQNGYGIEKLISDGETKNIIEEYFIPEFKKNNYYNGTINGVLELMKKLKLVNN